MTPSNQCTGMKLVLMDECKPLDWTIYMDESCQNVTKSILMNDRMNDRTFMMFQNEFHFVCGMSLFYSSINFNG
jgi:hypothetical protein